MFLLIAIEKSDCGKLFELREIFSRERWRVKGKATRGEIQTKQSDRISTKPVPRRSYEFSTVIRDEPLRIPASELDSRSRASKSVIGA